MKGYMTVEATFVVSICIWIMMAICTGGFYVHDKMVLETITNERTCRYLKEENEKSEKTWKKELKKELNKKLFYLQVKKVTVSDSLTGMKVKVKYQLPSAVSYLKNGTFKTTRENIVPAKYKWDYDLITE